MAMAEETVYEGIRLPDGGCRIVAHEPGGGVRELAPAEVHSFDFEWGYGGSGPAETAHALLLDATGDTRLAGRWHPAFKRAVVADLPHDGWRLSRAAVLDWLASAAAEGEGA